MSPTHFSPDEPRTGSSSRHYSGLFEYHIPTNTWTNRSSATSEALASSAAAAAASTSGNGEQDHLQGANRNPQDQLRSRSSHSMLFHPVSKTIS